MLTTHADGVITHDWAINVSRNVGLDDTWFFGLVEAQDASGEFWTVIHFGPYYTRIENVSAPVVAATIGLICTLIVTFIAARFIFRSPSQSKPG